VKIPVDDDDDVLVVEPLKWKYKLI